MKTASNMWIYFSFSKQVLVDNNKRSSVLPPPPGPPPSPPIFVFRRKLSLRKCDSVVPDYGWNIDCCGLVSCPCCWHGRRTSTTPIRGASSKGASGYKKKKNGEERMGDIWLEKRARAATTQERKRQNKTKNTPDNGGVTKEQTLETPALYKQKKKKEAAVTRMQQNQTHMAALIGQVNTILAVVLLYARHSGNLHQMMKLLISLTLCGRTPPSTTQHRTLGYNATQHNQIYDSNWTLQHNTTQNKKLA